MTSASTATMQDPKPAVPCGDFLDVTSLMEVSFAPLTVSCRVSWSPWFLRRHMVLTSRDPLGLFRVAGLFFQAALFSDTS